MHGRRDHARCPKFDTAEPKWSNWVLKDRGDMAMNGVCPPQNCSLPPTPDPGTAWCGRDAAVRRVCDEADMTVVGKGGNANESSCRIDRAMHAVARESDGLGESEPESRGRALAGGTAAAKLQCST